MKYCQKCGTKHFSSSARKCTSCGHPLDGGFTLPSVPSRPSKTQRRVSDDDADDDDEDCSDTEGSVPSLASLRRSRAEGDYENDRILRPAPVKLGDILKKDQ